MQKLNTLFLPFLIRSEDKFSVGLRCRSGRRQPKAMTKNNALIQPGIGHQKTTTLIQGLCGVSRTEQCTLS